MRLLCCPQLRAAFAARAEAGMRRQPLSLRSLRPVARLGSGAMGAVTLVTTTELRGDDRPRLFALKTILKSAAEEHGQQRAVLREKDVQALAGTGCAFCARLDAALHSERGLHLAMEFLQGGDLYSLLEREGVGGALGPRRALFYCGCVTLALRHLHLLRIVYRDLKVGTVVTHSVYQT
jgi:p70 ribosomal S6 kinase